VIYFVRRIDGTGPIKIGYTTRLSIRLRQLGKEWGAELGVLGVMKGGRDEEQSLHRRFSNLRLEGEWFQPEPVLFKYICKAAKKWDGKDEVPKLTTVAISKTLLRRIQFVTLCRNITVVEYLDAILEDIVSRDVRVEAQRALDLVQTREGTGKEGA
jgi:hypothetical protein